jgi:hypothetical protein
MSGPVTCLVIKDRNTILDFDMVMELVRRMIIFQPKDYYRIRSEDKTVLFFFDVKAGSGYYLNTLLNSEKNINSLPILVDQDWEIFLDEANSVSKSIDEELKVKLQIQIKC